MLELGERLNFNLKSVSQVFEAWEDNVGTKNLAKSKVPLMTAKKHISGLNTIGSVPNLGQALKSFE